MYCIEEYVVVSDACMNMRVVNAFWVVVEKDAPSASRARGALSMRAELVILEPHGISQSRSSPCRACTENGVAENTRNRLFPATPTHLIAHM